MSILSAFLHKTFGTPETHVDAGITLSAIEALTEDQLKQLASHLTADEARALSIAGTIIHAVAEARYAEVTGATTAPPTN